MTYEEHKKAYKALSPRQLEWLKHKCRWEHMTTWAVMNEWGVPSDDELEEDGESKPRGNDQT